MPNIYSAGVNRLSNKKNQKDFRIRLGNYMVNGAQKEFYNWQNASRNFKLSNRRNY